MSQRPKRVQLGDYVAELYATPNDWRTWPNWISELTVDSYANDINGGRHPRFPDGMFEAEVRDGELCVRYLGPQAIVEARPGIADRRTPAPPRRAAGQFAHNLRAARNVASLSAAELAKRMRERGFPWTSRTVRHAEEAYRRLYIDEIEALAQIVHVPLDRMITEPANRVAQIAKDNMRGVSA